MKSKLSLFLLAMLSLALSPVVPSLSAQTASDPGWPRMFQKGKKQLTVYQPQVDYWNGYTNM
jgi:hypothetical protein